MPYKPYTLPARTRQRCPFEVIYCERQRDGADLVKARLCRKRAERQSGWCREHEYVAELLELASKLDYPPLQVNASYLMVGGHANWEGDCERMPPHRAVIVKGLLIELYEKRIRDEASKE
jgi:hypothetical protein